MYNMMSCIYSSLSKFCREQVRVEVDEIENRATSNIRLDEVPIAIGDDSISIDVSSYATAHEIEMYLPRRIM